MLGQAFTFGIFLFMVLEIFPNGNCHHGTSSMTGDGKPPILSHVRVSRGPDSDGASYYEKQEESQAPREDLIMKPPSYHHRINRISQFHGNAHPYSDVTFNLFPHSHSTYPVASLSARGDLTRPLEPSAGGPLQFNKIDFGNTDDDYNFMADDGEVSMSPTFTPYIGSRVLSNIPKFFEHLHQNLKAMHDSESKELPEDASVSVEDRYFGRVGKDGDNEKKGTNFLTSDGRLFLDNEREAGYRYSNSDMKSLLDGTSEERGINYQDDPTGEEASRDLLAYMGRDPKYKKANNYNPSWLFTNLGLGKRSGPYPRRGRGRRAAIV